MWISLHLICFTTNCDGVDIATDGKFFLWTHLSFYVSHFTVALYTQYTWSFRILKDLSVISNRKHISTARYIQDIPDIHWNVPLVPQMSYIPQNDTYSHSQQLSYHDKKTAQRRYNETCKSYRIALLECVVL